MYVLPFIEIDAFCKKVKKLMGHNFFVRVSDLLLKITQFSINLQTNVNSNYCAGWLFYIFSISYYLRHFLVLYHFCQWLSTFLFFQRFLPQISVTMSSPFTPISSHTIFPIEKVVISRSRISPKLCFEFHVFQASLKFYSHQWS